MSIGDYIALGIIVVVLIAIVLYLVRQKKKGIKCIGCPHSKGCSSCNCGCGSKDKTE